MIALLALALLSGPQDYSREPLVELGDSVFSVTQKMGPPADAAYQLLTSKHGPKMRDVRATLEYPGMTVSILVALCCGKSSIEQVRFTDPAAAKELDLEFPETADDVRRLLGPPSASSNDSLEYAIPVETGAETVTFGLSQSRVISVTFVYFVE